ncbi:DUF1851 domain-containing protein [Pseudomonas sp. S60]|uniref:GAD-like domain-containing protein n=1 Tax=Pseudomonas sp. S60 TaxID=211124 RepID=UPI0019119866|nr:DUF1851 domain-containing protein [Pseudomonas sp. S60]
MRDEDFSEFIECFGEPTHRTLVSESGFEKWKNLLPPVLLEYWRNEEWSSYADGLI